MPRRRRTMAALAAAAAAAVATAAAPDPALPPMGSLLHISPAGAPALGLRHCDFLGSVTPFDASRPLDFAWRLDFEIDGLGYSFSAGAPAYDDMYLSPDGPKSAPPRLALVTEGGGWGDALFNATPASGGGGAWVLTSLRDPSLVVSQSRNATPSATCAFAPPSGDLVLLPLGDPRAAAQAWVFTPAPPPPPPPPAAVVVDASAVDHDIPAGRFLGCHVDPGWAHQPLSWHSNMVYGQSFEAGPAANRVYAWAPATDAGTSGTAGLDPATHVNPAAPAPSLRLTHAGGAGLVGWANRGLGGEGLAWEGGRPYEGFLWVRTPDDASAPPPLFEVRMQGRGGGAVAAATTLPLPSPAPPPGAWVRLNFTLTPSAPANCTGIPPGSDPTVDCGDVWPSPGHVCVRCGGEFAVGLAGPAGAAGWVGFVQLEAGEWGRFAGLSVRAPTMDALAALGVGAIRQGGTVSQTFRWKDWRGAPWARPAMQHTWGAALVAPWGPFEFADAAAAAGITAVLTFAQDLNSPEDWADLIEYCWGDDSTPWGAVRVHNDSHPAPYNVSIFELGNEQWNPNFAEQVAAMEARAATLPGAPPVRYMFPSNGGFDAATAEKLFALGGDALLRRTMPDCHVGEGGGVGCAAADFAALGSQYNISFINAEVNAQRSTLRRGITEAADLQAWLNAGAPVLPRLVARTASFCTARSGHFDGFDQGLTHFLPNATWVQPGGWAHAMVAGALAAAPHALRVAVAQAPPGGGINASAQVTPDGGAVYVQLVNSVDAGGPANVTLSFAGGSFAPSGGVTLTTLATPETVGGAPWEGSANTPGQPTLVAPVTTQASWPAGAQELALALPPFSFTIVRVEGARKAGA